MQIQLKPRALSTYCAGKGISRDAFARGMGIASSTAFRVEKGEVSPSPKFIAALMIATGLPFEALFDIVGVDDDERVSA